MRPRAAVRTRDDVVDGPHVQQTQDLGSIDRAFQPTAINNLGEIQQRAGEAGTRNAIDVRDVNGHEPSAEVSDDAAAPATGSAARRDVAARAIVRPQTPQRSSRSMRQRRPSPHARTAAIQQPFAVSFACPTA